ncbi:hypothetical protein SEMRO_2878_G339191.1 [Seminavis robusta]|uniref:Uncharacterized protein n=1 Tax=Seminavis robusta TaxID=568900 RepID=A0A9N8F460_9STRA|nr:hypothetical protein SEMRO_2878_G339191.1 [Seminavis robusta]|eukprot:Sro2878_g339191.1  (136) ;mRNA; f:6860-7267
MLSKLKESKDLLLLEISFDYNKKKIYPLEPPTLVPRGASEGGKGVFVHVMPNLSELTDEHVELAASNVTRMHTKLFNQLRNVELSSVQSPELHRNRKLNLARYGRARKTTTSRKAAYSCDQWEERVYRGKNNSSR